MICEIQWQTYFSHTQVTFLKGEKITWYIRKDCEENEWESLWLICAKKSCKNSSFPWKANCFATVFICCPFYYSGLPRNRLWPTPLLLNRYNKIKSGKAACCHMPGMAGKHALCFTVKHNCCKQLCKLL